MFKVFLMFNEFLNKGFIEHNISNYIQGISLIFQVFLFFYESFKTGLM